MLWCVTYVYRALWREQVMLVDIANWIYLLNDIAPGIEGRANVGTVRVETSLQRVMMDEFDLGQSTLAHGRSRSSAAAATSTLGHRSWRRLRTITKRGNPQHGNTLALLFPQSGAWKIVTVLFPAWTFIRV